MRNGIEILRSGSTVPTTRPTTIPTTLAMRKAPAISFSVTKVLLHRVPSPVRGDHSDAIESDNVGNTSGLISKIFGRNCHAAAITTTTPSCHRNFTRLSTSTPILFTPTLKSCFQHPQNPSACEQNEERRQHVHPELVKRGLATSTDDSVSKTFRGSEHFRQEHPDTGVYKADTHRGDRRR